MKNKNTKFKQTEIVMIPKDLKSLNDNIKFLLKIFEDVRNETEKNQKEKVYVWSEHYSNWIDIWKHFIKYIGKENFFNSCLGFRLTQLNKELLCFWMECTSGAYDNTLRSLRYILESFLQSYYIDRGHPNASFECKLEILKEIDKLMGTQLINSLDISGKYKEIIKTLYSDLCKFVHPSFKEWQRVVEEGQVVSKLIFIYDKKFFEECVELTDRVIDTIVFMLMNFCYEMINEIKNDKIFLESISNVKNSLVSQYIEEACKRKQNNI